MHSPLRHILSLSPPPHPPPLYRTGDITKLKADAIVNSTNESYDCRDAEPMSVMRAGGAELRDECRTVGPCRTGEVRVTKGHRLPARLVSAGCLCGMVVVAFVCP